MKKLKPICRMMEYRPYKSLTEKNKRKYVGMLQNSKSGCKFVSLSGVLNLRAWPPGEFFDKSGAIFLKEMKFSNRNRNSRREMRRDSQGGRNTSGLKKSVSGADMNAPKKSDSKTSKTRKLNPFYIVVRLFHELFAAYDATDQNTKNKRAALNMAVSLKKSYYPDRLRFWQELLDEANVLLDSKRFCESCKKLGLEPEAVAEHLVVEGKANWMKVLKEGLENYGEKVMMFRERLYEDKFNLYASKEDKGEKPDAEQAGL